MNPIDRITYWIKERESIRLKRLAGKERPWTMDSILNTYRFTNVRRMDDKVSEWLYENWYEPHTDHPNMLMAVAFARFINLPSSLGLVTQFILHDDKPHWGTVATVLRKAKEKGPIFNGAYMVRGNDGIDKIECVIDHYVKRLARIEIDRDSMEETWKNLLPSYGMGSFMAGQIVSDLRWAVTGEWEDCQRWAPMGPGSQRGMNRLLGRPVKSPNKQPQFLTELTWMIGELKKKLACSITDRLEAIDYQNCLCEFDKYERVRLGEGRPKQLYKETP